MEEIELLLLGLMVVSIVFLFISFFLLLLNICTVKKIKSIASQRIDSRRKKKKNNQKIRQLENEKRSRLNKMIPLFILSLFLVISSVYMKVYISRSISSDDKTTFVNAHNLVRNFEEQIDIAATVSEEEKIVRNINYLATAMASYGIYKANYLNSEEGQLILNRYYDAVKELGVNNTTRAGDFYGNPTLVEETKADIERIKVNEKKVLEFYKIDESVLEKS